MDIALAMRLCKECKAVKLQSSERILVCIGLHIAASFDDGCQRSVNYALFTAYIIALL